MFKRFMIGIITSLLLFVTACSGTDHTGATNNTGDGNNNGTTEGGQVELRIMWWGDQKRADITNEALKIFQAKHPDIKISGEFAPSSGYFDKLNTQLASGTAPDIFFLGGNVVDYAQKDVLLNLDPYVGNELNLDGMDETMIEYGRLDGKLQHISAVRTHGELLLTRHSLRKPECLCQLRIGTGRTTPPSARRYPTNSGTASMEPIISPSTGWIFFLNKGVNNCMT